MTSPYSLPDYRSRFFEYKTLTKILGEPTIDTIAKLHKEIKRNAQKVPTTLGGGQNGYLGLVIPQDIYNSIPGTRPFIRPQDPGPFVPTPRRIARVITRGQGVIQEPPITPEEITLQKIQYDEQLRLYNEVQAVEALLRTQIIEAIEEEYLVSLRNQTTDMIHANIPEIFNFLRVNYGQLSPQQLKERESNLDNYNYDPSTHINTVFNKIQDFQDICYLVGQAKPDYQLVNQAYIILQKIPIFKDSLISWNKRQVNKSYSDFKTFMRSEYNELQKVGGLTVGNTMLQSANLLKEIQEMKSHSENMVNSMKEEFRQGLQVLYMNQNDPSVWHPPESEQQVSSENHTEVNNMLAVQQQHNTTLLQLTKQLQSLQNQLTNLTLTNQNPAYQQSKLQKDNIINPKTGQPYKRYCWSCGCCPHWSKNCPVKKKGHKDEATFKNRMGGNNKNCL